MALRSIDDRCVALLEKQSCSATALAQKLRINRTTILYHLRKLQNEKRVEMKRGTHTNEKIWCVRHDIVSRKIQIQVFRGTTFYYALRFLRDVPQNSVVYSVQSQGALERAVALVPDSLVKEVHRIYKRKHICIKGMVNARYVDMFKKLDVDMLKSHIGRTVGGVFFSERHFLNAGEIISCTNMTIIINYKTRCAVVIRDVVMSDLIHEITALLFDTLVDLHPEAMLIDLNADLRAILRQKEPAHKI